MKYRLILTGKFKKSLKLAKKRGLDISLLESTEIMNWLESIKVSGSVIYNLIGY